MASYIPWIGFIAGLILVMGTLTSAITTLVVPRRISSRITYTTWRLVYNAFFLAIRLLRTYSTKDRVLAFLGPVSLLVLLAAWLVLLLFGYALIMWPLVGSFTESLRISGSSLLTLGLASSSQGAPTVVMFVEAATGLIAVALLIGYLPTIYGAYNRRETLVTMLESRAGEPAWGPEILTRESFITGLDTLPALYADWEQWAADVAESHVNYPWLMWFRSPNPLRSWVIGLLAVLDSAALYHSLSPSRAPSEARSCLRMGFTALRDVFDIFHVPYNRDPMPSDPISLTYEEFLEGVQRLKEGGFPIERSPEDAWTNFRGWRVNYEVAAYALADIITVVPALWSGPRRWLSEAPIAPHRPAERTPERPEGEDPRAMSSQDRTRAGELVQR